jgi:peptide alpha-N-acetyltransferase
LKHLSGDAFKSAFKDYALPLLKKGAPSVFHSVSGLYQQEHHRSSIKSVVDGLKQTFENLEDKKAQFWCLFFMAQHHDCLGESLEALQHLDKAYELDADIPDLFLMYGRVLKHSNMLGKAVECVEHARKMDLGDRFLNSKAVKYLLRAGELKRAQETIALFLKAGELDKQMADLADIQAIWFDLEAGKCLMAKGDYEGSKTYFGRVTKLYEEFHDDQLDFHNYALRKMNLTYYLELLRYERTIYSEPLFREAAELFIECCRKAVPLASEKSLEEAMGSLNINTMEQDRIELLQARLEKFPARDVMHVSSSCSVRTLTNADLSKSKFLSSLQ